MTLNISKVHPWYLRLLILIFIGLPSITGWPISTFLDPADPIQNLALWLLYGCFVWLFILVNIGGEELLKYLSFATVLALMTAFFGAVVRRFVPFLVGTDQALTTEEIGLKMTKLFITMIVVIPYALFLVNCFSVSGFLKRLSQHLKAHHRIQLHLALALRMFQHVGEVATNLVLVWTEENPTTVLPRFKQDWNISPFGKANFFRWFEQALVAWCFALLIHSLEAAPYLSEEMRRIKKVKT